MYLNIMYVVMLFVGFAFLVGFAFGGYYYKKLSKAWIEKTQAAIEEWNNETLNLQASLMEKDIETFRHIISNEIVNAQKRLFEAKDPFSDPDDDDDDNNGNGDNGPLLN